MIFTNRTHIERYLTELIFRYCKLSETIEEMSCRPEKGGKKLTGFEKVMGIAKCLERDKTERHIKTMRSMLVAPIPLD